MNTGKHHTENYNLATLIEQGELNIRSVAATTKNMTAGEYFDMLSELIDRASTFKSDLHKLISRDSDRNTYKSLAGMFNLLKNLGYEKHAIDFDAILDAYDRGHSRLTSAYAKKIMDSFSALCAQITAAMITHSPEDPGDDPHGLSLREWLELRQIERQKKEIVTYKPIVLAVDDSPMVLKSVSTYLSDDYKVYMLAKSFMLEKTLSQVKPDLFLLDYNMPVLNGFELIPVIRSFPEHKNTPIIFLTSEGRIENISGAVILGACDFIVKPVQRSVLRERVSKHIAKKGIVEKVS